MDSAYLYILRCADGSLYVGTTRKELESRVAEHNAGTLGGYTATRRPVSLAFAEELGTITDAIAAERQIKGWSRAKKEALIRGDWQAVSRLSKRRKPFLGQATSSFETGAIARQKTRVNALVAPSSGRGGIEAFASG